MYAVSTEATHEHRIIGTGITNGWYYEGLELQRVTCPVDAGSQISGLCKRNRTVEVFLIH